MGKPRAPYRGVVLVGLLKDRPHATGAEIGVNRGITQRYLLQHLPGLERLYSVDPWLFYPEYRQSADSDRWRNQAGFDQTYKEYLEGILPWVERVHILRATSRLASLVVPDESLDFVFIDANHCYEYVSEDIALWTPKVKAGGLVIGDDHQEGSCMGNTWGVIRAVHEAFGTRVQIAPHHIWWTTKSGGCSDAA